MAAGTCYNGFLGVTVGPQISELPVANEAARSNIEESAFYTYLSGFILGIGTLLALRISGPIAAKWSPLAVSATIAVLDLGGRQALHHGRLPNGDTVGRDIGVTPNLRGVQTAAFLLSTCVILFTQKGRFPFAVTAGVGFTHLVGINISPLREKVYACN